MQERPQLQADLEALLQRECAFRHRVEQRERPLEGADGLAAGGPRACKLASLAPIADGLVGKPGLGVMVGDELGQAFGHRGEPLDQNFGDAAVQRAPPGPEQRRIGGVLYQRVLERVGRVRRHSAPRGEAGDRQAVECRFEVCAVQV